MRIKKGNLVFAFALAMAVLLIYLSASLSGGDYSDYKTYADKKFHESKYNNIKYVLIEDVQQGEITFATSPSVKLNYYAEREDQLDILSTVHHDTLILKPNKDESNYSRYVSFNLELNDNVQFVQAKNASLTVRGDTLDKFDEQHIQWLLDAADLNFNYCAANYNLDYYFGQHQINAIQSHVYLNPNAHFSALQLNLIDNSSFNVNNNNDPVYLDAFSIQIDKNSTVQMPGDLFNQIVK